MSYDACLKQACKRDTKYCLHNTGTHRHSAWAQTCFGKWEEGGGEEGRGDGRAERGQGHMGLESDHRVLPPPVGV